jgi:hypothetical protein
MRSGQVTSTLQRRARNLESHVARFIAGFLERAVSSFAGNQIPAAATPTRVEQTRHSRSYDIKLIQPFPIVMAADSRVSSADSGPSSGRLWLSSGIGLPSLRWLRAITQSTGCRFPPPSLAQANRENASFTNPGCTGAGVRRSLRKLQGRGKGTATLRPRGKSADQEARI